MVSIKSILVNVIIGYMIHTPTQAISVEAVLNASAPSHFTPAAHPADLFRRCTGNGYATFFDDNNCKVNPSIPTGMDNPVCLQNQRNRKSVKIQAACSVQPRLVFSPGIGCDCQNYCQAVPQFDGVQNSDGCWNIEGLPAAQSFRFVRNQNCGINNCGAKTNGSGKIGFKKSIYGIALAAGALWSNAMAW